MKSLVKRIQVRLHELGRLTTQCLIRSEPPDRVSPTIALGQQPRAHAATDHANEPADASLVYDLRPSTKPEKRSVRRSTCDFVLIQVRPEDRRLASRFANDEGP